MSFDPKTYQLITHSLWEFKECVTFCLPYRGVPLVA